MAPAVNGVKAQTNGVHKSWQEKHDIASHFIGGNKLENAPPSKVKDFVQEYLGHSVITSVCGTIEKLGTVLTGIARS